MEVKDENGATVQKNTYDGLSRRITKESGGTVVHIYWSDRWKPVEERIDTATTAARQYLWGERPGHRDELILRDRDTNENGTLDERLYATMDYFNGTSILNTSGNVLERYAYAAFGPRRVMAPDFTSRSTSLYDWAFGFQGQFRDAETGLYNYGYRFYVPELGRWINRDPIEEAGGVNLYAFAANSPTETIDYPGLSPQYTSCECNDGSGRGSLVQRDDIDLNHLLDLKCTNPLGDMWFKAACVTHDYCYATCGADKGKCDVNFFADMVAICASLGNPTGCEFWAGMYHMGVAGGGNSAFAGDQGFDALQREVCACDCHCGRENHPTLLE